MFFIPLYTYIGFQTLVWIWSLILFSESCPDHWLFRNAYPKSFWQKVIFTGVLGFFNALSGIAGHELVHQKSPIHKFFGNWPYIKSMYTHFWDEHVNGHHKHLATDRDPVCHAVGSNLYTAVPKAIYGTHLTSYHREVERLTNLNNGEPISLIHNLTFNRMFQYFAFNVAMCYSIYITMGYKSLAW